MVRPVVYDVHERRFARPLVSSKGLVCPELEKQPRVAYHIYIFTWLILYVVNLWLLSDNASFKNLKTTTKE